MERHEVAEWLAGLSLPDLCNHFEDLAAELAARDFSDLAAQARILLGRLMDRWSPVRAREPE